MKNKKKYEKPQTENKKKVEITKDAKAWLPEPHPRFPPPPEIVIETPPTIAEFRETVREMAPAARLRLTEDERARASLCSGCKHFSCVVKTNVIDMLEKKHICKKLNLVLAKMGRSYPIITECTEHEAK